MSFIKRVSGLIFIQLIFITVIILVITAVRFIFPDDYQNLKNIYSSYALYDTDISLVYDGE